MRLKHRQHSGRRPSTALSIISARPSATACWVWLGFFAMVIALLGGSSRHDPVQIAVLRPASALLLIPSLYYIERMDLRRGLALLVLLGLTAAWMALQLVPLPASLWSGLPDRAVVAQIDQLVGLQDIWRPLSMAPFRGANALASLIVPTAALLLALAFKATTRQLLLLIVGIGLIDAGFGLLQVIGGARSPLYLFAITSRGAPAGIFANENHSAVFSAIVLVLIARLWIGSRAAREPDLLRLAYPAAFAFIFLAILVSGSRAGLVAALAALAGAGLMFWLSLGQLPLRSPARRVLSREPPGNRLLLFAFPALVAALLGAFLWLERTPAFSDLLARNAFEDLRWSLWPVLQEMAAEHWLLGSGFGSFDAVYRLYEPTSLLLPRYVNQAHNDWAQLVIEGGLPATVLLLGLLGWTARCLLRLNRRGKSEIVLVVFWLAIFAILGGASIVDYPLRTPVFQVALAWLLLALASDSADASP